MATKLTAAQRRVIALLIDGATIQRSFYENSWKINRYWGGGSVTERTVNSLSQFIDQNATSVRGMYHLELSAAGLAYARENGVEIDAEKSNPVI